MSTTPSPEQPDRPTVPSYTAVAGGSVARLPLPGNAEFVVYLLIWIVIALIWIISDEVGASDFSFLTVVLTVGYLLSRGIAKASRVLEQ